MYKMMQFESTK